MTRTPRPVGLCTALKFGEHEHVQSGIAAVALVVMAWPEPLKQPVVAVFGIEQRAGILSARLSADLTVYISTRLAENGYAKVVPQAELKRALEEQTAATYRACYDESCQVEIGKAVAAQQIVSTGIQKLGDVCVVSLTVYDLATAASAGGSVVETECSEAGIFSGIKRAVAKLLGVAATPAEAPPVVAPATLSPASTPREDAQASRPPEPTRSVRLRATATIEGPSAARAPDAAQLITQFTALKSRAEASGNLELAKMLLERVQDLALDRPPSAADVELADWAERALSRAGTAQHRVDGIRTARAAQLRHFAQSWLGVPYAKGGSTRAGIDGPIYVRELFRKVYNVEIPETLRDQLNLGREIRDVSNLEPGDLLFKTNDRGDPVSVRVYIGAGLATWIDRGGVALGKHSLTSGGREIGRRVLVPAR